MSELIDREAVREFIKSYRHSTDVAFDMEKNLDEIPAAPRWHRAEDELPPAHENLLCCGSRGGMFVGWVLGSAVCICGSCTSFVHGGKGRQFTHWMPLPEPPKEDA